MGAPVRFVGRLFGAIPAFATGLITDGLSGAAKNVMASVQLSVAAISGNPAMIAAALIGDLYRTFAKNGPPKSPSGAPTVFRQSISDSFIVYGKRRVGGLLVFFHAAEDSGDHFRYFVIACAGHRCQGATKWFLNDEEVIVDVNGMVTTGAYADAAWLWFQRGLASETANETFVGECDGQWTENHKGNGVAAIYAKFEMTEDVVQAGMPNITAEIEGRDEIRDSRDDTLKYTNNAALVFYDWMKLPREEGGFGAYADEIPDDSYISAQANVSDETVNGEPRYTLNGVIVTGAAPIEVRDAMIVNCAGSYTYSSGKHQMRVGYWVPVSETLSEDDLAGPIQVSPFLAGDRAATEVLGTYVEPAANYLAAPFAAQSVASEDVRQVDLDLAFTTSKHQAERVAGIMLKRAQCEMSVTWPMNIAGLKSKALDTVALGTSRYGLDQYAYTVVSWGLSADFQIVANVREENEDIYDPPAPVAPPSVPPVTPGSPINPTTDAGSVSFPPSGNIEADTVQGAIQELDAEKVPNSRSLTAGAGLTGGGDLSADRTFAVGAGTGITVNADDVALDTAHVRNAAHPGSSTDNAMARFDSTAGALQDSSFIVDDNGHVASFGGNIKFPGTAAPSADANTLDDYEEGTFTAQLLFGGASVGMTGSFDGRYTKVGREVIFHIRIVLTAKGSSTGPATISGLPFTSINANPTAGGSMRPNNLTTVAVANWTIAANSAAVALSDFSGSVATGLTDADFTATASLIFSGSYTAA